MINTLGHNIAARMKLNQIELPFSPILFLELLSDKTTNSYFKFNLIVETPLALCVCSLDCYLTNVIGGFQRGNVCLHEWNLFQFCIDLRKRCFELDVLFTQTLAAVS